MKSDKAHPESMDDYVALHPKAVQEMLQKLRATIRKAAPGAEEAIKYGMPTFTLKGNLVFFSAFKNHIGFYSIPEGNEAFRRELAPYAGEKGSLRFQLTSPIPYDLVKKIVTFRVKEIQQKK